MAGRHFRSRGTLAKELALFEAAYLFDPLCGWCYAAAPALQYLQGVEGLSASLAPTGPFAGAGAQPMDAQFAAYAEARWPFIGQGDK